MKVKIRLIENPRLMNQKMKFSELGRVFGGVCKILDGSCTGFTDDCITFTGSCSNYKGSCTTFTSPKEKELMCCY